MDYYAIVGRMTQEETQQLAVVCLQQLTLEQVEATVREALSEDDVGELAAALEPTE